MLKIVKKKNTILDRNWSLRGYPGGPELVKYHCFFRMGLKVDFFEKVRSRERKVTENELKKRPKSEPKSIKKREETVSRKSIKIYEIYKPV